MAGEHPDGDHQEGARNHSQIGAGEFQKKCVQTGTCDGRACVNMFFQHIGRLSCHDVPQNAASDPGDDAEKDDEKMVAAVTGGYPGVDARDGKRAQADGVQDIHDFFIGFDVSAAKQDRAQAEQQEQDHHRQKGGEYINRIAEHVRWDFSDHQVPDHSASHGRDDAEDDDAEQIQLFPDGHHGSGGGKGDGSDDFYDKNEV